MRLCVCVCVCVHVLGETNITGEMERGKWETGVRVGIFIVLMGRE